MTKQDYDFLMSACNASGVARSLVKCFDELSKDLGTYDRNTHPHVKAFILKLADLAGIDTPMTEYEKLAEYFEGK
jgi:hypothetical protein